MFLELKYRRAYCCCSLRWISPPSVITVRVEVAYIWHNRISVGEIGSIIPPVIDPVFDLRILPSKRQLLDT
jgi:hypothetical protein